MSISAIQAGIVSTVSSITELKAVYTYPITDLGRKLPALVVLYDGFDQVWTGETGHEIRWRFEFSLFLPADGKNLKAVWDELIALVPALLGAFRNNPGLGGTCWISDIEAGETVIHAAAAESARFVGHTFRLVAKVEV